MTGNFTETYRGVAYPWLCDIMGHLTTQHYVGMFDQACWHLFLALGFTPETVTRDRLGWADVKNVIDYQREVPIGGLVRIDSGVTRLGTKSMEHLHVMKNAATGEVHASFLATTVYFDLDARQALPLPNELKIKAGQFMVTA